MAKQTEELKNDAAESAPVTLSKLPVFTFCKAKDPSRTFEFDLEHVQTAMSRADLKYIGTIPLPPKRQ